MFLARGIAVLAGAGTVLGFLGHLDWRLELASHFRPHYAAALLFCIGSFWVSKRRVLAVVAGALAAANLVFVIPLYALPKVGAVWEFTVLSANVLRRNPDRERLVRYIEQTRPDVVVLMEVSLEWLESLRGLQADYPYARAVPRDDDFGIAVFSRLPFMEPERVLLLGEAGGPTILVPLDVQGARVTLIATHPRPPISATYAAQRNEQLEQLADVIAQESGPLMVVGDLNVTPWSHVFRRFVARTGLRDSQRGFGVQGTWPTWLPIGRLPIDHCLVSNELVVGRRRVGPDIGSDHLPIVIALALRPE